MELVYWSPGRGKHKLEFLIFLSFKELSFGVGPVSKLFGRFANGYFNSFVPCPFRESHDLQLQFAFPYWFDQTKGEK